MSSATQEDQEKQGVMAGENVWPSGLPAFREAALKY